MTIRNIETLTQLRDALTSNKKRHDQSIWAAVKLRGKWPKGARSIEVDCATSACAAGHACLLAGDAFVISELDLEFDDKGREYYHPVDVRTPEGELIDVADRAQQLLGLTYDEREVLFYGENSHKETVRLLDALIAGEDIVD